MARLRRLDRFGSTEAARGEVRTNATARHVQVGPNAPLLARIVRNPQPMRVGRFERVSLGVRKRRGGGGE
ncbi:MAG: hypothetical protein KTR31_00145 [Myxococcales bacterium]|nr:hypothetical protein [Myxococcales bacterium]